MAKCNLPEEERAGILRSRVLWEHSDEELEKCRAFFDNYLFIEITNFDGFARKVRLCTCSRCGQRWEAEKDEYRLHHGDAARCPWCDTKLTVQLLGRLGKGNQLYQTAAVSFVNVGKTRADTRPAPTTAELTPPPQAVPLPLAGEEKTVCIESGIAFYDYRCDWEYGEAMPRMEVSFIGKKRYYMRPGAVMGWKRWIGNNWARELYGVGGWEETSNITEPFSGNIMYGFDGYGYFVGLEKLDNSALRYSAIAEHYAKYHKRDIYEELNPLRLVPQYLAEYALHPQIEMAVKLGMSEAVGELVRDGKKNARDIDWNAGNPAAFVRLSKAESKEFYKNPSLEFLSWYHSAIRSGSVQSMAEAQAIVGTVGIPNDKRLNELCRRHGVRLFTAAKRTGSKEQLQLWTDYVEMAEKLEYDLSGERELFPRNLRERHDAAAANLRAAESAIIEREYQKRYEKLKKKYEFAMDGLKIVVPRGVQDIVTEGKTLCICVGGYAGRHVNGKTTILFLRHERRPERSYICIELTEDGKLVQIHGYRNEGYRHSVSPKLRYKEWLDIWQEWYRNGSRRDRKGKPIIERKEESA